MKEFACQYAIGRFLPYPQGGEFVNVGAIIYCPATGFLNFKLEAEEFRRVTDFFPELEVDFYREGLAAWNNDLNRIHRFADNCKDAASCFAEAVKPKAGAFRFGPVGSVLTPDPQQELERLFKRYVLRQSVSATADVNRAQVVSA